jgi:hypothetical protein
VSALVGAIPSGVAIRGRADTQVRPYVKQKHDFEIALVLRARRLQGVAVYGMVARSRAGLHPNRRAASRRRGRVGLDEKVR